MRRLELLFAAALASGCATGFDRGAIQERLAGERQEVSSEAIAEALSRAPQLRFPFKLGIYLGSMQPSERWRPGRSTPVYDVEWRVADKEKVLAATNSLKEKAIVSDAFFISDMTVGARTLEEVRLGAARHGADAVLVVRSVSQVDRYVNPLCLLNLLILPGWFVPASHRDALLVVQGVLWDVRNEFLYATAESEGTGSVMAATFVIDDQDAIDEAKEKALADFGAELVRRIEGLRPTQPPAEVPTPAAPPAAAPAAAAPSPAGS